MNRSGTVSLVLLGVVALFLYLYNSGRLSGVLRAIAAPDMGGGAGSGVASVPGKIVSPVLLPSAPIRVNNYTSPGASYLVPLTGDGSGTGTGFPGQFLPVQTQQGIPAGMSARQAKDAVRDAGYGYLVAAGPYGAAAAGILQTLGVKL